jgi:small subunit ribosomal protein S16
VVKIRLRRMGTKKRPFYRIVVTDSRNARDGRFIENIGYYDPTVEPPVLKVDLEKAQEWIGKGAQPSDTVRGLLKKMGMLGGQSEASIARAAAKIEAKKRGKVKAEAPAIVEEKAAPAEEVAVEEVAAEAVVEEAPAKKRAAKAAAEEAPAEEPAVEAVVEEAPAEEAAAEEPAAEETPAEKPAE